MEWAGSRIRAVSRIVIENQRTDKATVSYELVLYTNTVPCDSLGLEK